jgi:hypothetical protein
MPRGAEVPNASIILSDNEILRTVARLTSSVAYGGGACISYAASSAIVVAAGNEFRYDRAGGGGEANRRGDCNGAVFDPVDRNLFWLMGEYAEPHVLYAVRAGHPLRAGRERASQD